MELQRAPVWRVIQGNNEHPEREHVSCRCDVSIHDQVRRGIVQVQLNKGRESRIIVEDFREGYRGNGGRFGVPSLMGSAESEAGYFPV